MQKQLTVRTLSVLTMSDTKNPIFFPDDGEQVSELDRDDRNPLIIPSKEPIQKGCPICGGHASGRGSDVIIYTCLNENCKNTWQSGLQKSIIDPKKPNPPMDPKDRPVLEINWNARTKQWEEDLRPVDPTPDFRKGALITDDDDWSY